MSGARPPSPRADAVRNRLRIVEATREVIDEHGPHASLGEVARRAGVGAATLFRHFPDRAHLLRAALDATFADRLGPALEAASRDPDAYRGLVRVLEATLAAADAERSLLTAGAEAGVLDPGLTLALMDRLGDLVRSAQAQGALRGDLVAEDVPRVVVMLVGVLMTTRPGDAGWRRYLALVLDGLGPHRTTALPAVTAPTLPRHVTPGA